MYKSYPSKVCAVPDSMKFLAARYLNQVEQQTMYASMGNEGGRHFVDIIGDISWTKEVTSRGHFW